MKIWRKAVAGWCCVVLVSLGGVAVAEDSPRESGQPVLHGFVSQGFSHTTDNQVHGGSTAGSLDFRELGLGGSWRPHSDWLLAVQLLSRHAGAGDNGEIFLDYALADFSPFPQSPARPGVSVGRIRNPFGLYNDTRDVAFGRPGIFLPQTVYLDKVRELFVSMDGVQLHAEPGIGDHSLQVQLNLGREHVDDDTARTMLGNAFASLSESEGLAWVGRLLYSWKNRLLLGLGAGRGFFTYDVPRFGLRHGETGAVPGHGLRQVEGDARYWLLSLQYHAERWSLTGEYVQEELQAAGLMLALPHSCVEPRGWYLQADYRVLPAWVAFLRHEDGRADKHYRRTLGDSPLMYSRGWVTGLRWDIHRQVMLRLEYAWHDGGFILSQLDNPDPTAVVEHWNMLSALLAFRF